MKNLSDSLIVDCIYTTSTTFLPMFFTHCGPTKYHVKTFPDSNLPFFVFLTCKYRRKLVKEKTKVILYMYIIYYRFVVARAVIQTASLLTD